MAKSNRFTVISERNDHDHAAVRVHLRNETYHIVDYGDRAARERVADLPTGSVVELELSRAGRRSNVRRADSVHVAETDGEVVDDEQKADGG